jgi:hypothetical protein
LFWAMVLKPGGLASQWGTTCVPLQSERNLAALRAEVEANAIRALQPAEESSRTISEG